MIEIGEKKVLTQIDYNTITPLDLQVIKADNLEDSFSDLFYRIKDKSDSRRANTYRESPKYLVYNEENNSYLMIVNEYHDTDKNKHNYHAYTGQVKFITKDEYGSTQYKLMSLRENIDDALSLSDYQELFNLPCNLESLIQTNVKFSKPICIVSNDNKLAELMLASIIKYAEKWNKNIICDNSLDDLREVISSKNECVIVKYLINNHNYTNEIKETLSLNHTLTIEIRKDRDTHIIKRVQEGTAVYELDNDYYSHYKLIQDYHYSLGTTKCNQNNTTSHFG